MGKFVLWRFLLGVWRTGNLRDKYLRKVYLLKDDIGFQPGVPKGIICFQGSGSIWFRRK